MIADKIALEIATPERLVLAETVDSVILPGSEGYLGVLPMHAPLLTSLGIGRLEYRVGARNHVLALSGGFAEVLRDRVRVLADTCERPEEIDLERALAKKREAEAILASSNGSEEAFRLAEGRLRKALVRIEVHGLGNA